MYNKFFILRNLKDKYLNSKISIKIIIYFSIIFVLSTIILTFTYRKLNSIYNLEKMKQSSVEVLESAEANTSMIIDNADNVSKMIISSDNVQGTLKKVNKQDKEGTDYDNISKYLIQFTNFNSNISSIYILDDYGNKYYSENVFYKDFQIEKIKDSEWYNELLEGEGKYILKLNGGGFFDNNGNNYVSLIRVINDINTGKKIGILIINMDENVFHNLSLKLSNQYGTKVVIQNEKNELVTGEDVDHEMLNAIEKVDYTDSKMGFLEERIHGKDYIVSNLKASDYNWKLTTIALYSESLQQTKFTNYFLICFSIINFLLIIIGSMIISKFITRPLKKLSQSMKEIEGGEFNIVNIKTYNDEVGELKKGYNIAISQINLLLNKIHEEEKIKRQTELNLLMSQIKPHFLYNTFDTINSLALLGENKIIYKMIKALGKFYRTSLNNGKDIITVKEELNTVKSYLIIQNIRYQDMIETEYDLDPRCDDFRIIKLVLQPLVENAIYHGIRNSKNKGKIKISTFQEEEKVLLTLEDNGAGMDESQVRNITENRTTGIGVRATKERLRVFYGNEHEFIVESKKNVGTKITIKIPRIKK
ncbi:sensor histidine kinase [Clostridium saccharobutylicum]|uniref:histidine kinase n=2 Tax=Clostridium saccharobutylicum TaxID=169679 RepID=U5MY84_CLOSA|nr:sensor histidine kinase [Clostridium saccharobutylicum]AGX44601.1 sensor histidine kinase YesM [Clostridium saccharobutylicum DSM 13864]AQR91892.1 putative sensor-like histidine kinase [Clostridium saccharobutylicum]AQS01794.1 putative sensor-like histidine kinase [Clostridium saccharobutylicum]AQS15777.1 putative sensor-like histidine kinase [Clostridium saccharobutylicum]MBA8995361.1 two-component system sensor histidine kinase YesM [Clostridium saccharobutylicum]